MRVFAPKSQALALTALFLSIAMVILAWPRLRASLIYLPVDTALNAYWSGQTIDAEQLTALAERAELALDTHPHYRYRDGLSILQYLRGLDDSLGADARRRALTDSAQQSLQALAQAPMKPASWLRMAAALDSLGEPAERVVPPLLMSVYTGRVEPTLLLLRLQLLYRWQRDLDPESLRLLVDQTLLTWRLQPRELVAQVRSGSIPYDRIARALAPGHPVVLDEIDEVIRGSAR